jgi:type II secretory pathway pseudopilin PulG
MGKILKNKQGFGLVEALIAAAVLGILYVAILNLQGGNRDALLRIRGRDGATEVAQNIIDSLGALGLASLSDDKLKNAAGDVEYTKALPPITRTWDGQPGVITNKMTVVYNAEVTVSPDADYMAKTSSLLLNTDSASHVYAKRLDVKVSWHFKNSVQSITVSGVIR